MSGEELKTLIRKQGSLKHRLTIFKNHIDGLVISNPDICKVGKEKIIELEIMLNKQEALLQDFEELQTLIECLD